MNNLEFTLEMKNKRLASGLSQQGLVFVPKPLS